MMSRAICFWRSAMAGAAVSDAASVEPVMKPVSSSGKKPFGILMNM